MLSPEGVCSGETAFPDHGGHAADWLTLPEQGQMERGAADPEDWVDLPWATGTPIEPVDGLQYNFHWDHWADIWAARGMFGADLRANPCSGHGVRYYGGRQELYGNEVVPEGRLWMR